MVTLCRTLFICLTLLFSSSLLAVEIEAKLDSPTISIGDTVELTVTVNEQAFNSEPDFSILKPDFEILSKRQSSQYSMINGRITSSTSWILTLLPKRQGYVAIPPIRYENAITKALKLHVSARKDVDPKNTNQLLFVDASVDKKEVYVQEQLIYTIRVFWSSIELFDSSFSAPQIDDAVMEQLGDRRNYRSTINGRSYEVIEFRYAVFPQKSGELTIPPAELLSTVFANSRRGFGRDPFNGKQVRRTSPELTINVKPKPDSYPADKPWLPTRSLQLQENWAPKSKEIKVGEPVTRSIIMEADGLADTVLPPIPTPSIPGIKVYPEQANTNSTVGAHGMVSKRVESQAIIATQLGTIEIPQVDITWWDVNEEAVKVTSLPARKMTVVGSTAPVQTDSTITSTPASLANSTDVAPQSLQQMPNSNSTWQWIAIGSLGLWLVTVVAFIGLYLRGRNKSTPSEEAEPTFTSAQLKSAKKALKEACNQNDPKQAREALINLFKQHWQDNSIKNLDHIAQRSNNEPLSSALLNLDKCLYQPNASKWESGFLLKTVEEGLSKTHDKAKEKDLAPLYPT